MESDKVIGYIFGLNKDIIDYMNSSTAPKFITRLRARSFMNKLIKSINKLDKANSPLTIEALIEFFGYIYSNFPPTGEFENISYTKYITNGNNEIWTALVLVENIKCIIRIDLHDPKKLIELSIVINEGEKASNYDIRVSSLTTTNTNISEAIYKVNESIWHCIKDYILLCIDKDIWKGKINVV